MLFMILWRLLHLKRLQRIQVRSWTRACWMFLASLQLHRRIASPCLSRSYCQRQRPRRRQLQQRHQPQLQRPRVPRPQRPRVPQVPSIIPQYLLMAIFRISCLQLERGVEHISYHPPQQQKITTRTMRLTRTTIRHGVQGMSSAVAYQKNMDQVASLTMWTALQHCMEPGCSWICQRLYI